jgi:hypothetical protein
VLFARFALRKHRHSSPSISDCLSARPGPIVSTQPGLSIRRPPAVALRKERPPIPITLFVEAFFHFWHTQQGRPLCMASLQSLAGREYWELSGIREARIRTKMMVSRYQPWPASTVQTDVLSVYTQPFFLFFSHFIHTILLHSPFLSTFLSHSQLLLSLIRSLIHPTATNSLQTKRVSNPIVSVPRACKDGLQQRQKGGVKTNRFPYPRFRHAPPPLSCLLVVLYCMPYLN